MTCGCNPRLGAAPAAQPPMSVTLTDFPCRAQWAAAQNQPSTANQIRYNLCLAQHKAGKYILDAGHWIWAEIQTLWNRLWGATKNIAKAGGRAAQAAWNATAATLQHILKQSQGLVNWLLTEFERDVLPWLAIGGLVILGIVMLPEIIEATAIAGAAKRVGQKKT